MYSAEAGISVALVRAAAEAGVPLLGVCLGHQAIGEAFGGGRRPGRPADARQDHAWWPTPAAGCSRASPRRSRPCGTTRSWWRRAGFPTELEVTAWSSDRPAGQRDHGAVRIGACPVYGVQFHPESVGTDHGKRILANFLSLVARTSRARAEHR